jgi:hypothetical protein
MNEWTPHWIMRLRCRSEEGWFNLALSIVCALGIAVSAWLLVTGQ